MADSDVVDMLTAWGLSNYIDVFKEQDIDVSSLSLLTEDMIKKIIPMVGHRAKFKGNLEEWKKALTVTNEVTILDISNLTGLTTNETLSPSSSGTFSTLFDSDFSNVLTSRSVEESKSESSKSDSLDVNNEALVCLSSNIDKNSGLKIYLQSITEGRVLLATYKDSGLLDNTGRRKLCNIIVRKELQENPEININSQKLLSLSEEITQIFPKEHISTYFIPYMNYGANIKKAAKGKLLDCFNNRKREYKKAGIITSTLRYSPSIECNLDALLSSSQENDTEIVDDQLIWLHNSSDPWDTVEKYGAITRQNRLRSVLDPNSKDLLSISNYMKKFPALKKPAGYNLLIQDFNFLYPKKQNNLVENFPLHKSKILELGRVQSNNLKDKSLKSIIDEYLNLTPENDEASSLAAFLILSFLFSPITTKRKRGKTAWRPSKIEMKDGFITHIKSHIELQDTVTRRKEKYAQLGTTLQPLIIIVGPNCNNISQYFVLVDDTFYVLNSILSSVDCCFKIMHALNLQYPVESLPIWSFIQKGFYKIKTPWDTEYVCVNSLLSDLGIYTFIK